jgi:purine-binding chemotaxis protein CheW
MNANHDGRYMQLRVGPNLFAIPLLSVKEVISKSDLTSVPNMPSHFEGMMNLRGQILGVYSARKKLGIRAAESKEPDVIVIIENHGQQVGVIVDDVVRVIHAETSMLREAPLRDDEAARRYIQGVIEFEKDLIQIVNMVALLEVQPRTAKSAA